jgi:hypothetical protein
MLANREKLTAMGDQKSHRTKLLRLLGIAVPANILAFLIAWNLYLLL